MKNDENGEKIARSYSWKIINLWLRFESSLLILILFESVENALSDDLFRFSVTLLALTHYRNLPKICYIFNNFNIYLVKFEKI